MKVASAELISSQDLLEGLSPKMTLDLETLYGNGDLIKVLDALGIAGPLRIVTPWELEDASGHHLISAASYAATPFGEMYPPLVNFLKTFLEQNRSMSLPQQTASEWRAALEANLITLLSRETNSHSDSQVFFSNSGAEAVEAALKFLKAGRPKAKYLINFQHGYHGKTFGALSLTPNEEFQAPFRPLMQNIVTLPFGDAYALEQAVKKLGADNVCGIVLEPIQGEGGVILPEPDFLPAIESIRQKYGILVLADEIQTGLGRTGHWFASVAGGLDPDIITLAKPLGGGLVAVGATIARKWIVKKMLGGLESKRHSNTFGGGSLAMAVGLKSLEIIAEDDLVERSRRLGEQGLKQLQGIQAKHPDFLEEVRGAGMLFALKFKTVLSPKLLPGQEELARQFGSALALRVLYQAGVHSCYTLNSSQVLRLTPALTMPEPLFETMLGRVEQAAQKTPKSWQMIPKAPVGMLAKLAKLALIP